MSNSNQVDSVFRVPVVKSLVTGHQIFNSMDYKFHRSDIAKIIDVQKGTLKILKGCHCKHSSMYFWCHKKSYNAHHDYQHSGQRWWQHVVSCIYRTK